ncbi:triose-phosphate isomerase [Candidatus Geothermarchaeota archaeon]|nr:MAG: triose-phosphate isomerase [Candidatus Geothermarchaeota archaeon]
MKIRKTPLIIVNFKAYREAIGRKALILSKIAEKVAKEYGVSIAVAPQLTDIRLITERVDIPVLSQHIDPIEQGAFTGHVSPLAIKEAGAVGSLINHSERKLRLKEIKKCVEMARKYGLISVCCAATFRRSREIAKFGPDFIAYEPPELIGTDIPVSMAKPEIVTKTVNMVKIISPRTLVLCGAGIKHGKDVKRALELGTAGVLVASGVVKANNPEEVLADFAKSILASR